MFDKKYEEIIRGIELCQDVRVVVEGKIRQVESGSELGGKGAK